MRPKKPSLSTAVKGLFICLILSGLFPAAAALAEAEGPFRAAFDPDSIRTEKNLTYAAVDGRELKLDLYIPENTEGPLPLVVWIHGGAWMAGSKDNPPARALLASGFAVASISYRFSDVAIFPAQIHDCKAAVRFLRAHADKYRLDPERIGTWGASAGAHLAALLGTTSGSDTLDGTVGDCTDASDDVQAVCDWFGPADMATMSIGKRMFEEGQDPEIKLLGGTIAEKRDLAELASPITHVSKGDPPFLIMHGDRDPLVPLQQSQLLADMLKAVGVDVTLTVMEGKGHGGFGPQALVPVVDFFKRTLAPKESDAMFQTDTIQTARGPLKITFIGHGTLMFEWDGRTIHIDPWTNLADYSELPDADIILLTHEHGDHLDAKAIGKIRHDDTTLLMSASCADAVSGGTILKNGDQQQLSENLTVKAVPAYNIEHKRSNGQPYHPKGRGNGYVITFADTVVYVAGDTENIPEMAELKDIDVAFLPMNLPYTMTPEMAARAARTVKPKVLYPYHYGDTDVNKLVQLLEEDKEIDVRIRNMQ